MNPIQVFGTETCAVVLIVYIAIGIWLGVSDFSSKYSSPCRAGVGSMILLILYVLRSIFLWLLVGWSGLLLAAFLMSQIELHHTLDACSKMALCGPIGKAF